MWAGDPDIPGDAGAPDDPRSPLDGLVGALIGRRVRGLRIVVRDGGLVLRGRASSYHAKQLAQHTAMAVTDLPLIANEIVVACLGRGASGRGAGGEAAAADPEV
jgi:hypothetical protein